MYFAPTPARPDPHGAYFAFEILWRGVGYGIVDTLLLTAFPCVVACSILHGKIHGFARTAPATSRSPSR